MLAVLANGCGNHRKIGGRAIQSYIRRDDMRTEQYEQGPEEKGGAGILRNVTGTATSLLQAFLLPTIASSLENVEKNTIITGT